MPPRKSSVPVEADPDIEIEEVEESSGPKFRKLKYLGPEPNFKCYATSPPLDFVDRICATVPETVAAVIIKNKKKNKFPLFKDVTPGVKPLIDAELDPGLPELADDELFDDRQ